MLRCVCTMRREGKNMFSEKETERGEMVVWSMVGVAIVQ